MKLEKFKKYGKINKKIIGSIVGITIVIVMFILFKSFAFFESKYDFDVIKGRIPNFTAGDVTLAFTIDGVKNNAVFPNKGDGYVVKSVTCSNGVTAEWNNVLWGLVNVNNNEQKKISCNIDFAASLYKVIKIGDYVSYTPSSKSYKILTSLTGYSSDQTINPSELNLWRVIKKNEDGTIEMISEYASSTLVYLDNKTGYDNALNLFDNIAKQYETEGITNGSRLISNDTDRNLVKAAMPSGIGLKAYHNGTENLADYWYQAIGDYHHSTQPYYVYVVMDYDKRGYEESVVYSYCILDSGGFCDYWPAYGLGIRPILKLRKDISLGIENVDGTINHPYKIN